MHVGRSGTVESNVFERVSDHVYEWANCYQVVLDTGELVTVGWDQVTAR